MINPSPPVNVLITVDTEFWPRITGGIRQTDPRSLKEQLERDIYGVTAKGEYGITYQMDVLEAYGLKAVFFVEALFACVTGIEPLAEIVTKIKKRGHEVQLHIHTEWLDWMPESILKGRTGKNMRDFSEEEQCLLIAKGLSNLKDAGISAVQSFRAGNYGADFATLRALACNGISFDTSYNFCYLDSACGLRLPEPLIQPQIIDGVCEVPISFFSDYPGHNRHAQLIACSYREFVSALTYAWQAKWHSFVLVSHSFELLARKNNNPWVPDRIAIRRFEQLCQFLGENRDKFRTVGFSELDPSLPFAQAPTKEYKSSRIVTMLRYWEQLTRRMQR